MENFFSASGRIRRSTFGARMIGLGIPLAAMNSMLTSTAQSSDSSAVFSMLVVFLVIAIPIAVIQFIQSIKRLHDLDSSGWACLLFFIPLINLGLFLYLLFKDGTIGENQYGTDPKGREKPIIF